MSRKSLPAVFAHPFGAGDILVHPNGKHVYTCGTDGDIRVFDNNLQKPQVRVAVRFLSNRRIRATHDMPDCLLVYCSTLFCCTIGNLD